MGVKLMYVFALPYIEKQLCTKICFSSLDVSECSYWKFLQCTINNDALFEFLFVMLSQKLDFSFLKPGFHYTANATTMTRKQSDYKVEQSSFTLIALF